MQLNPEQLAAVQHGTGPLRLIACAGSGKSATLVERVAHLHQQRKVSLSDILVITFSRTAREEMAKRLDKRMPGSQAGICARTFHSIGLMVYKAESKAEVTIDSNGILFARACKAACDQAGLDSKRAAISRFSTRVKNELLGGDPVARRLGVIDDRMFKLADKIAAEVSAARLTGHQLLELFFATETIRTHTGVFDNGAMTRFVTYDDMIYESAVLLRRKETREAWARRWKWVLADEAQDTNAAQAAIAEALVSTHRNYTIVGDAAQAVFGFRGADPRSILDFDQAYPGAKTIVMHRNYRSGIEICALASRIVDHMPADSVACNEFGETPDLYSERQTHSYIACHRYESPAAEASAIADNIIAHRAAQLPWEEQAVLVRMNRMTRDIEIALATREVPYKLASGNSFFTMPESECLLGYVRLLAGRATADVVRATLRHPSRRLRKAFIDEALADHAVNEDWLTTLRRAAAKGKPHEQRAVEEWARFVEKNAAPAEVDPGPVCISLRAKLDLDKYFGTENEDSEDSRSKENLNDIVRFAEEFDSVAELIDAIENVEAHRKKTSGKRKAVLVSTVHGAKGREFGAVYVPCLVQGLFPVSQADTAEERRVFYVACTRAKDELWLSWAPEEREDKDPATRSRFLSEVDLPDTAEYEPGRKVDDVRVGSQLQLI